MVTAGIDTGCLVDNVILGLAEPFQRNNREQLTKLAHDSGSAYALTAVLSHIRQYSRLNPTPDGAADGVALAATGRRKFTGTCHYCHIKGHMIRDCRKKKADEKAGRPPPIPRGGGTPQPPASAPLTPNPPPPCNAVPQPWFARDLVSQETLLRRHTPPKTQASCCMTPAAPTISSMTGSF